MGAETAICAPPPNLRQLLKRKLLFLNFCREVGEITQLWPSRPSAWQHGGTASREEVDGTELPLPPGQPTLDPVVPKKHTLSQLTPLVFLLEQSPLYPNTGYSPWPSVKPNGKDLFSNIPPGRLRF